MSESAVPTVRKAGMIFIFVTLLIDVMGMGLLIPIFPQFVALFLNGDLSVASTYLGAMFSLYTAMQFVFAPILGALSDAHGRKPILIFSLAGSVVANLLTAFAPGMVWLFIGRFIGGIAGSSFSVAGTYIADLSAPEDRGKNFGMIGAAFGLGFILGPALGGLLANYGLRVPFIVAAGLTFVNLVFGLLMVPESHAMENRRPFSWAKANPIGWAKLLARYPVVLGLVGTFVFAGLGQQAMQNTWVLFTSYRFHWSPTMNGLSLALVGVTTAIVQGGLIRVILPRLGERRAVVWGMGLSALSMVLYGLATESWMMFAILTVASVAGISGPASQGIISREVGPDEQGLLQGALMSLMSLTGVVAPLAANTLFARFTAPTAAVKIPGIAFYFAGLCLFLALLNAMRVFRKLPGQEAPSAVLAAEAPQALR